MTDVLSLQRLRIAGACVAAVLVLTGCGGTGGDRAGPEATPTAVASDDGTGRTVDEGTTGTVDDGDTTADDDVTGSDDGDEAVADAGDAPVPMGSGCTPGTTDTLPDGRWFGHIVAETATTLTFDLVCWYVGEDAVAVSIERGLGSDVPNDNIMVNDNDLLRTLPVAADATALRMDHGDPSIVETVDWDTLRQDHGGFADDCPGTWCPAWLEVTDGTVRVVEMQYVA